MECNDWLVTFNEQDMAEAQREARVRCLPKILHDTHIPPSSPYHSAYAADLIGVMGERAAAFALGVQRQVSQPSLRGNDGWNFLYRGWRMGVCNGSKPGHNMWTKIDDALAFDIYVHCNMADAGGRAVRVVAWVWRAGFFEHKYRTVRPSGDQVLQVAAVDTLLPDDLLTIVHKEAALDGSEEVSAGGSG